VHTNPSFPRVCIEFWAWPLDRSFREEAFWAILFSFPRPQLEFGDIADHAASVLDVGKGTSASAGVGLKPRVVGGSWSFLRKCVPKLDLGNEGGNISMDPSLVLHSTAWLHRCRVDPPKTATLIIYIFPMAYGDDHHHHLANFNLAKDPIIADPITPQARQLRF